MSVTYPSWLSQALQTLEADYGPGGGSGAAEGRGRAECVDNASHGAGRDAGHLGVLGKMKIE